MLFGKTVQTHVPAPGIEPFAPQALTSLPLSTELRPQAEEIEEKDTDDITIHNNLINFYLQQI